jgi:hypothetical protein
MFHDVQHPVKTRIAPLLTAFVEGGEDGESVTLDVVELIALRMRWRDDYQVGLLGLCVRANLVALERGILPYGDVLNRFTTAALAAPQGHVPFTQAVEAGMADLLF